MLQKKITFTGCKKLNNDVKSKKIVNGNTMLQDIKAKNRVGENTGSPQSRMFRDLDAKEVYCPHCKMAVPVRKRLLLVLPEGDKYEYLCPYCTETVGFKIDQNQEQSSLIV